MSQTARPLALSTSPSAAGDEAWLLDHVCALLRAHLGRALPACRLVPLLGDASDRRYYRVLWDSSVDGMASRVVMRLARPYTDGELPFVNVQRYLALKGVPVPQIVCEDAAHGVLVLEDLGDLTLEAAVQGATPAQLDTWYRQALDILLTIQAPAAPVSPATCVAFRLAFDVDKLMGELDFFVAHMLERLCGQRLSTHAQTALRGQFWRLCAILARQPRVLAHRDYHSRNLMLQGDRLRVIDFQDARLGPCQYDLASLLCDSYVMLPDAVREALLAYYLERKAIADGHSPDRQAFLQVFDYMCLQRHLKALGTFAYQITARGNPRFHSAIPITLAHLQRNLANHPELSSLRALLDEHLFAVAPAALRDAERRTPDTSPAR
jgi:aminoglycoside/choline kinase family phosphotransferase